MSKEDIKPWHLAVLALAVIVVLWKAVGYVGEQRRQNDGKYNPGTVTIQGAPGSTRAQQEAEK
jgi:hypothetical protein